MQRTAAGNMFNNAHFQHISARDKALKVLIGLTLHFLQIPITIEHLW